MLLSFRNICAWAYIIYFIIFETIGKSEIGLKFLVSGFDSFLQNGFTLAILQLPGKDDDEIM